MKNVSISLQYSGDSEGNMKEMKPLEAEDVSSNDAGSKSSRLDTYTGKTISVYSKTPPLNSDHR